jgi:ATP-binding cassette, subfamily B, bacterial
MQLLFRYVRAQQKVLVLALILAAVNIFFSLLDPQIFRLIVDNYAGKVGEYTQSEFIRGVVILLLSYIGVSLVSRIAKNFQDFYVSMVTQRVGATLYSHSVNHSFSLPYKAFEDERSGELLLKLQKARTDSQALITTAVNIVFLTLVAMVFIVLYTFTVNALLGTVYLLIIPVVGVIQFTITRKIKAAQTAIVTESASLAGSTTETLRNVELVKSLGLEEQETQRLNNVNERILGLELKKIKLIRVLSFIQGTLINAIRAAILLLMLWLIYTRDITFGEFFTLYIYLFFIIEPLNQLSNLANTYQEARASMDKLEEVLNTPSEKKPTNPVSIGAVESIEFRNVSFTYGVDSRLSLENVSLKINKGETVAFVGPSGAGKTTMVKLLLGLYTPTGGEILINGTDAQEIDYDKLRRRVGYVSQDTQLFAGTVRENLLFVNPKASDEEATLALKHAAALTIIERGGKGLDTKIGEGGIKLSGGEKQRLAIARALLRNPDLIVFDEASSSLDSLTEKEITSTIQNIVKTRPNLITAMIAHRLSTVSHADRIYVLEGGKITEEGTHDKLLKKKGLYAALFREQVGNLD